MSTPFIPVVVKPGRRTASKLTPFPQPQFRSEVQISPCSESQESFSAPVFLDKIIGKPIPGFDPLTLFDPENQGPVSLPENGPSSVVVAVDFANCTEFAPDVAPIIFVPGAPLPLLND